MMAYAVLGRGMLNAEVPKVKELTAADIRAQLPRFHSAKAMKMYANIHGLYQVTAMLRE